MIVLPFSSRSVRLRNCFRSIVGNGSNNERYPNRRGKHPERKLWQLVQQWYQMSIINVKASKQDNIRPNHPHNMRNHPVLPRQTHYPVFSTESSCCIATQSESIPDQGNKEEVGIYRPAFERQNGGRKKHQSV